MPSTDVAPVPLTFLDGSGARTDAPGVTVTSSPPMPAALAMDSWMAATASADGFATWPGS
jgi:hypothetical protein